jgi:hypothetical protein
MRNIVKLDSAIAAALKRIDFQPLPQHKPSLYAFLRFEMYDVQPQYLWTPDVPQMPAYFNSVIKNIRHSEEKVNHQKCI